MNGVTITRMAAIPTGLMPAVKFLWSRTLFPGSAPAPERPRWASLFALVVLPALILYPCLGFHLFEPDEGRYAEIPREMLARGEWVVPQLQGEPYLDKPPLMYWLVMLSYQFFGVNAAAARLVPALAVHGCILATYLFGCRYLGERQALRGAILLAIMPGLAGIGRLLTLDGLLSLWIALGLYSGFSYLRERSPLMGIVCALACGLGVLTKGPVALILVLVPLVVWSWLYADRIVRVSFRGLATFAAVVLAVNLPWYVLMAIRQPGFLRYFFWQHNVERFLTPFDHLQPVWYYAPILLGGLLPGAFWLWSAMTALFGGQREYSERRSPELSFCLLAGGFCVLFFSLSGSKLPTYVLSAFPPLALGLAVLLHDGERLFRPARWAVLSIWLLFLAVVNYIGIPAFAHERSSMRNPDVVRAVCADPAIPVVCYPRNCDAVSFYLGRDDFKSTRSKHVNLLIDNLMSQQRTVVLFTHRHSLEALRYALPPQLHLEPVSEFHRSRQRGFFEKLLGKPAVGVADMAIVERNDSAGQ